MNHDFGIYSFGFSLKKSSSVWPLANVSQSPTSVVAVQLMCSWGLGFCCGPWSFPFPSLVKQSFVLFSVIK